MLTEPALQEDLQEALEMVRERQQKDHPAFYRPLPKKESKLVRPYYRQNLKIPEFGGGEDVVLKNECGTIVSTGYKRVIIGDYGAFVEFSPDQLVKESIGPKFPGPQRKDVSYLWYETKDAANTKIYLQQRRVLYAEYSVGMYYVSPDDVFLERTGTDTEWRPFTRIAHIQHTLEARRATGGEPYGNPDHKLTAIPGQWLCRNPENGHTWVCEDQNFGSLYRPPLNDRRQKEPKAKKPRGESKNRKKIAEAASNQEATNYGPLFESPTTDRNT